MNSSIWPLPGEYNGQLRVVRSRGLPICSAGESEATPRRHVQQSSPSHSRVRGGEQRPSVATRQRDESGTPAETDVADREYLRPFLEDFARELGDEAPLSSSITRTLNIFSAAVVPTEQWDELL